MAPSLVRKRSGCLFAGLLQIDSAADVYLFGQVEKQRNRIKKWQ
uniref:Uncharacterized protein n=1 Tax=Nelumbo nucifera TaxID=4432 RepID=A0A822ZIU0_NELNU|nr:TPA_asm: hypothetical protein HUJ06_003282 [Nelumbo nucifera]